MSFRAVFEQFSEEEKYQSLNFAVDGNLLRLLVGRLQIILQEISSTPPEDVDANAYARHMAKLHAQKEDLQDLIYLCQTIKEQSQPQNEEQVA